MGGDQISQLNAAANPDGLAHGDSVCCEVMGRGESVEQFRELMEHLQQVFWIKNATKKGVLYVSPAYERIWGRTCESLYDNFQSLEDSIHPEDRERIAGAMDGDQDVEPREQEFRILRPDGEIRWIRSLSYPVRNEQGDSVGARLRSDAATSHLQPQANRAGRHPQSQ
jgi:PAS domain S-box-containing protein